MPLLREKNFTLRKFPKDLPDDEEVFFIPFTREIFRHYRDYIARLELYKQKVWTCRVSGKRGLTYEQALESEQTESESAESFPSIFIEPTLHLIQFSTARVDQLADEVCNYFKTHFIPGDIIKMQEDSTKKLSTVKVVGKEGDSYRVVYLGQADKDYFLVKPDLLLRTRVAFSKKIFKKVLREVADKDTYPNAPWVVKKEFLNQYPSVPKELPSELASEAESRKTRKRRRSSSSSSSRAKTASTGNSKAKKQKVARTESDESNDDDSSPSSNNHNNKKKKDEKKQQAGSSESEDEENGLYVDENDD